jgi:hypothetical protein
LTLFGDWMIFTPLKAVLKYSQVLENFEWKIVLVPWEIFVAITPFLVAAIQESNSVILSASIILTFLTVLSIILNNFQYIQGLFFVPQPVIDIAVVLEETDPTAPDKTPRSGMRPINFVKDQFHAQFLWNANLHNDKKSVRHKV